MVSCLQMVLQRVVIPMFHFKEEYSCFGGCHHLCLLWAWAARAALAFDSVLLIIYYSLALWVCGQQARTCWKIRCAKGGRAASSFARPHFVHNFSIGGSRAVVVHISTKHVQVGAVGRVSAWPTPTDDKGGFLGWI